MSEDYACEWEAHRGRATHARMMAAASAEGRAQFNGLRRVSRAKSPSRQSQVARAKSPEPSSQSQIDRAKSPKTRRQSHIARAKSPEPICQSQVARAKLPEPGRRSQVARDKSPKASRQSQDAEANSPASLRQNRTKPSEAEAWEACLERWDRRVQVAAITAAPSDPDHYNLRQAATQRPVEAPRRRLKSVVSVARPPSREPDPADYEGVWPKIPSRH